MRKKIAYITGTRADFGLMMPILKTIDKSKKLKLQLYAIGMHLMPEYGKTINLVKKAYPNTVIIPSVFKSNDRLGMANFLSESIRKIIVSFSNNRPNIMLVLGDRPEMLCAAIVSLYLGIPVAHIHGGDKTRTIDDSARHVITKLSHLHFPATKQASKKIEKMGEEKWRIHIVGAPSLDTILNKQLLSRKQLFKKLNLPVDKKLILVTQHPVSEEISKAENQIKETINAVKRFNLPVIIIYPNADAGSKKMINVINKQKNNSLFRIYPNIDYFTFLSLEKEASVWIGNSSAAIIDSASLHTPVINIGTRQQGRQQGNNIINVNYSQEEIYKAIKKSLHDKKYLRMVNKCKNPWGKGNTASEVIKILENIPIDEKLLIKK